MRTAVRRVGLGGWLVLVCAGAVLTAGHCYKCPLACSTESGSTCAAGSCMSVCELGAADAQLGEDGWTGISSTPRDAICNVYCSDNAQAWTRAPCSSSPGGSYIPLGPCGLATSGQCCFYDPDYGEEYQVNAGYQILDCLQFVECVGGGET